MVEKIWEIVLLFCSKAHKSWVTGPILTEYELDEDFMSVLVTWKLEEAQIELAEKSWKHCFPITSLWEFLSALKGM